MSAEKPSNPDRRSAIQLLLGVVAATAIPQSLHAAPGYEGVNLTPEDLIFFDQLIHDPHVLAQFRKAPDRADINSLVRVLARTDDAWTKDIERKQGELHAGSQELYDANGVFKGNGTMLRIRDSRVTGSTPAYRYVLATAAHVAHLSPPPKGRKWTHHPSADAAVRELSDGEVAWRPDGKPNALHLGTTAERRVADISGKVGVAIGRDTDTGTLERKLFPSRISPRMSDSFFKTLRIGMSNCVQSNDLRLVVLTQSEAFQLKDGTIAAQGMSGAALVFMPDGAQGVEFGGLFVSICRVVVDGQPIILGHITDHVFVREAIDLLFREDR